MKAHSFWRETFAWNRREWITVGCFAAVTNVLMLAPTLYMLQIYDRVMVGGSLLTLASVTLITVFLFCVMALADWFRSRLLIRVGLSIDARLSPAVFRAAYRQRLQGQQGSAAQSLGDLTQVRQFLTGPALLAVLDVPWIPVYVAVLFLLHPVLGCTAIVFGLLQLGMTWLAHRGSGARVDAAGEATRRADATAAQLLRAGDIVSAMGMGARAQRIWQEQQAASLQAEERSAAHQARWTGWSKWLRYTQQSAALGVGAWLVIHGELTAGAMIAGNVLTNRALSPLDAWAQTWGTALAARKALGRLVELFDATRTPLQTPATLAPAQDGMQGLVQLDGVGMTFPERAAPVLEGINLVLRAGQVTLLQGPSGSGKTTLARAVLGVVTPTAGTVAWNLAGRDAADAIGYVPQSVDLFDGSIADNIARFGQADTQQVIEAARLAGLHETIQRMPFGYDTPVGVSGLFLSGGQRQRIALARAVYGQPDLVVLDEPNAQLDIHGEMALQAALAQLKRRGCAVLVISHRPGVAQVADQVVTLDKGRIVQRATPRPPQQPPVALAA